jgi:hypothetical protein
VTANEQPAPRLRLRKEAFDEVADRVFGADMPDYRIAEQLGTDAASLSLYRNGHRQPPPAFIATVLARFPQAKFEQLFEHAAPQRASA